MDRPKRRGGLLLKDISDEVLVLDRDNGYIHQLNATARYVFEHCDGTASAEEIVDELARDFGVSAGDVEADVRAALQQFGELGLLES